MHINVRLREYDVQETASGSREAQQVWLLDMPVSIKQRVSVAESGVLTSRTASGGSNAMKRNHSVSSAPRPAGNAMATALVQHLVT